MREIFCLLGLCVAAKTPDSPDGPDFANGSCWNNALTLVVEGGMTLNCTGKNIPRHGTENDYVVVFNYAQRGDRGNLCKPKACRSHTQITLSPGEFNFTESSVILRTPFFNKTFRVATIETVSPLLETIMIFFLIQKNL